MLRNLLFMGGGARPILDVSSVAAAAAYSVRRLRSAHGGPALRVRRASDNAEQDIGINSSGNLDTTSLLAFCSATDGFVVTWYDQSGNVRDLTQATAANQPRIVTSGALSITLNGRPGIVFDGVNDSMSAASWGTISQPFSRHYVATKRATEGHLINSIGGSPNAADYAVSATESALFAGSVGASIAWNNNASAVLTSTYSGASSTYRLNGVSSAAADTGALGYAGVRVGSFNGSLNFHGADMYELIITLPPLSSPGVLERNQGAYYGITVA
jgi:hypothetical protein